ncbi:hypothetical protein ABFB09_04975 [Dehalogenimonas sp. THU2]|uniref:hypothetical protein n=1 Tax=Dehalogenimonas sp. THU2 TaxID=3151121 RepID=UPI003218202F
MSQDMESNAPRRRGCQPGNQNVRTHGFYSKYARCFRAAWLSPEPGFDSNIESHD